MKRSRFLSSLPQYQADGSMPLRVNFKDPLAVDKIASAVKEIIMFRERNYANLLRLILCIGSDRSTGDALGPIVGARLAGLRLPRVMIWGTLADPVHALNLESRMRRLHEEAGQPLIIAVDASLGKPGSVGLIEIGNGPLHPGAGVHKKLAPIGHLYLSGIVNLGGFMEQMILQSTRLFHVMELATIMAAGLQRTLTEI